MKPDLFEAPDYYNLDDLLTEEHIMIRDAARAWVKRDVSPIIEQAAQDAKFPKSIIPGLASIGAFGPYIPEEYGGAGLDQISYGLIMQEIERGDSGVRSTASVQSSLVMYPIWKYGTEEQKQKFLPKLASGEFMGSFGLTEPDHGSNPSGMVTRFKDAGDHIILNGAKLWISNSPFCDVAVVWAKDENDRIHGVLGIAWGAIGAAMDCYDTALRYSKERIQFGKPIAGFQLQQKKLAEMITEITKAQLLAWRLGVLREQGKATSAQISMAKRNNVEIAINIAREARQILGGMGITGEYSIMRHSMNLESVITYEGTHDIHLLITGLDITGENAFK